MKKFLFFFLFFLLVPAVTADAPPGMPYGIVIKVIDVDTSTLIAEAYVSITYVNQIISGICLAR